MGYKLSRVLYKELFNAFNKSDAEVMKHITITFGTKRPVTRLIVGN